MSKKAIDLDDVILTLKEHRYNCTPGNDTEHKTV